MCVFPNYTASTTECFPSLVIEYFPALSTSVFLTSKEQDHVDIYMCVFPNYSSSTA